MKDMIHTCDAAKVKDDIGVQDKVVGFDHAGRPVLASHLAERAMTNAANWPGSCDADD